MGAFTDLFTLLYPGGLAASSVMRTSGRTRRRVLRCALVVIFRGFFFYFILLRTFQVLFSSGEIPDCILA